MVFSDDFLHFLKIKTFFFFTWIHQNYLVALSFLLLRCCYVLWCAEFNDTIFPVCIARLLKCFVLMYTKKKLRKVEFDWVINNNNTLKQYIDEEMEKLNQYMNVNAKEWANEFREHVWSCINTQQTWHSQADCSTSQPRLTEKSDRHRNKS